MEPSHEVSLMELRAAFVALAAQEAANVAVLCRRFGISRKTAYKWLGRRRASPCVIVSHKDVPAS
jgi:transposase